MAVEAACGHYDEGHDAKMEKEPLINTVKLQKRGQIMKMVNRDNTVE